MIDLYTSRREMFNRCEYYSQNEDEDIVDVNQIGYFDSPTGFFYAKEINAITVDNQVISEMFMAESISVVLFTYDDVDCLKRNDLVKYNGLIYRVDSIQIQPIKKQRQFRKNPSKARYISLRG